VEGEHGARDPQRDLRAAPVLAQHLSRLSRNDSGTNGLGGSTNFVHIDPLSSIPVTLSKFLTGGGPGLVFNVADTQFGPPPGGPPLWPFADLDRRLQRLFDLSHCTSCITIFPSTAAAVDRIQALGAVPADIDPTTRPDLKIGAINDLGTVQKILDLRASVADAARPSRPTCSGRSTPARTESLGTIRRARIVR